MIISGKVLRKCNLVMLIIGGIMMYDPVKLKILLKKNDKGVYH